jgi:putative polyhydroxyalkanoate system protein
MPSLSVAVPHVLGQEQATQRLKERFGQLKERFGSSVSDFEERWEGCALRYGFTALGVRVRGSVNADDSEVRVTAELPLLAMAFKGTIETQIRDELTKVLA